jgi:DNA-directed RNA polymerase specialized sigma24 family protein
MELKRSSAENVPSPGHHRGGWILSRAALKGLLSSLGPDEARAGQEYERLRARLIVFFTGRRCPEPEDSADETIDRVTRRIEEGEGIGDVVRFAYGVARLVFTESLKRRHRHDRLLTRFARSSAAAPAPEPDTSFASGEAVRCIRHCTGGLPPDDRDLILQYYTSGGRDRQGERRALATRLDLSPVALRLRAFRIRRALEKCTRECLAARPAQRRRR